MREKKFILCLANKCFVKCPGCYHIFPKSDEEVTNEEIMCFFKEALKNGLTKVTFAGGDPLTRIDIIDLIQFCHIHGLRINIDTVGTPFLKTCKTYDRKKTITKIYDLSFLKNIDFIGIPLDGSNDEVINLFRRGRKNFLSEQLAILSRLEKEEVSVCINTVLHRGNFYDLKNINSIISRFKNVVKWQIFEYMPIGDMGYLNRDRYQLLPEQKFKISELKKLSPNITIEYKTSMERENSYMFINSVGDVYKINIENKVTTYGNIRDKTTWKFIFSNL